MHESTYTSLIFTFATLLYRPPDFEVEHRFGVEDETKL